MSGITRTKLGFESLERKQMLAGDVLVSLIGGHLVIEGDAAGNQIAISSGEAAGTYLIRGLDGTVVKMADAAPGDPPAPDTGLVVEGVRGNVRVGLGEGDDTVIVHDARFRHNLTIGTGAGEDKVFVGVPSSEPDPASLGDDSILVRGSLLISTGADGDIVRVGKADIGGLLAVSTDGGDDSVNLGDLLSIPPDSPGEDTGDPATLRARLGVDVLLGEGTDSATLRDVSTRAQVVVGGGEGADTIRLLSIRTGLLGVRGGPGEGVDNVTLARVNANHAAIGLGEGADQLSILDSTFNSLAVALGAGNDSLSIKTVTATNALLAGGEGDGDELSDAGDNTFRHVVISGFELPPDVNTDPILPRIGRPGLPGGPIARLLGRLRR